MVTTARQLAALAALLAVVPQSVLAIPQWGQCGGQGWSVS
jgi:hypothetical protein